MEPNADFFAELMRQVRAGDQTAAAELVRQYEPFIRRAARNRLRGSHLRRVLDSVDLCQSVLASLFARAGAGECELESPEHLQRLLNRMVRNKAIDLWRRYSVRILGQGGAELAFLDVVGDGTAPDEELALRDLAEAMRKRLSAEERQILDEREAGTEWTAMAAIRGESPDALRKKLSRALERVALELGLRA